MTQWLRLFVLVFALAILWNDDTAAQGGNLCQCGGVANGIFVPFTDPICSEVPISVASYQTSSNNCKNWCRAQMYGIGPLACQSNLGKPHCEPPNQIPVWGATVDWIYYPSFGTLIGGSHQATAVACN